MACGRLIPIIEDLNALALSGWDDPATLPTRDELGHRRPTDIPFLAWRARRMGLPTLDAASTVHADATDVRLWRSLAELGSVEIPSRAEPSGPFLDQSLIAPMGGIEVWTETELASLHALVWAAALHADASSFARVLDHCRWHIEHTQPDNATNRPWAIHLFLMLAELDASHEARLYAQTLAHNCRVTAGTPDAISAQILFDAADAIGAIIDANLVGA